MRNNTKLFIGILVVIGFIFVGFTLNTRNEYQKQLTNQTKEIAKLKKEKQLAIDKKMKLENS